MSPWTSWLNWTHFPLNKLVELDIFPLEEPRRNGETTHIISNYEAYRWFFREAIPMHRTSDWAMGISTPAVDIPLRMQMGRARKCLFFSSIVPRVCNRAPKAYNTYGALTCQDCRRESCVRTRPLTSQLVGLNAMPCGLTGSHWNVRTHRC